MQCTEEHLTTLGSLAVNVFAGQKQMELSQAAKDEEIVFYAQRAVAELAGALDLDKQPPITDGQISQEDRKEAMSADNLLPSALLAVRLSGQYPYYIEKIMAAILLENAEKGVALRETLMGLTSIGSPDILHCILEQAEKMKEGFYFDDAKKVDFMKKAYAIGFEIEQTYKGCGQCAVMAIDRLLGESHEDVFKSATGFSGGMALCGDGVCGGYAGGMMMLCLQRGRSLEPMKENGDKENQYAGYEASQMLHDKFVACYGSPICEKIHEGMFDGESFILRTKERRNEFEEAGAHKVVCTTVVALACAWIAEILLERELVALPE